MLSIPYIATSRPSAIGINVTKLWTTYDSQARWRPNHERDEPNVEGQELVVGVYAMSFGDP